MEESVPVNVEGVEVEKNEPEIAMNVELTETESVPCVSFSDPGNNTSEDLNKIENTGAESVELNPSELASKVVSVKTASAGCVVSIEDSGNKTDETSENVEEGNKTEETSENVGEQVKINVGDAPEPVDMETDTLLSCPSLEYTFENACQITGAWKEFKHKDEVCMKGCKWSPDGTCILTNSDDNVLRVFDLPRELHCQESWQQGRTLPELEPALRVQEGGLIYDYCWYPLMSSWNPLSCCLVSTSKDSPIHLWDAFTGELRCTYRAYNAVDEVEAAYSLAFNPSGEKLYCGFKNFIRVFDINTPGRQCITRNLKRTQLPTQRQLGIISCLCVNPVMPKIYVAASYSRSVGVYSEPDGTLLCLLLGHAGGVTHVQFSPDGTKLFSGGRKDPELICWDIRNPGNVLFTARRHVATNQRIYFDITPDSRYFVSGNTTGSVSVWDTSQLPQQAGDEPVLPPCTAVPAHSDCVNGVSLHQQYPILATASGQRHVTCSDSESDTATDASYHDTSLKLWWVGGVM